MCQEFYNFYTQECGLERHNEGQDAKRTFHDNACCTSHIYTKTALAVGNNCHIAMEMITI